MDTVTAAVLLICVLCLRSLDEPRRNLIIFHQPVIIILLCIYRNAVILPLLLRTLLVHPAKFLILFIAPSNILVDHIIIQDLILFLVVIIFSTLEEDILDLLPTLSLTTVQVIQSTLDKQLVQVHLECSPLQNVLLD